MAVRLIAMKRVLKPTGSIYRHCDPTASHYLKLVMDAVFGAANFRNEITWRRTNAHNNAKRFGNITDIILYYGKTKSVTWNTIYGEYSPEQLSRYREDETGRLYRVLKREQYSPV